MVLSTIIDNWVASHDVPERVAILARDIVAFKCRSPRVIVSNVNGNSKNLRGFLTLCYHNKGIEMIDLPKILNTKIRYLLFYVIVSSVTHTLRLYLVGFLTRKML